jgi:hypothetical protein
MISLTVLVLRPGFTLPRINSSSSVFNCRAT